MYVCNVHNRCDSSLQALAVYGQMTRNIDPSPPAPDSPGTDGTVGGGEGEKLDQPEVQKPKESSTSGTKTATGFTTHPLQGALGSAAAAGGIQHFTAATSPTRSRDFEMDI